MLCGSEKPGEGQASFRTVNGRACLEATDFASFFSAFCEFRAPGDEGLR